jgi:HSP20 family protein
MAILFRDPFEDLLEFQRALDTFRASDWLETGPSSGGAYPPLNVFKKGEDFVVLAEAPGLDRSKLNVQVENKTVRISGIKSVAFGQGSSVHRRERLEGAFDRTISIPFAVDAAGVKAEYRDGILALYLPRAEHDKPKSVTIS